MEENQNNSDRINNLEASVMHLQKDYDALNEVVLENVLRIEKLTKTIQGLTDQIQSLSEPRAKRSAEDEIPPHY